MRYQTELMRSILTDETAQKIIDYVSPIYGDSYVGLWLFQAIGTVLGELRNIAEKLRHETTPATADLLLDYWEASGTVEGMEVGQEYRAFPVEK